MTMPQGAPVSPPSTIRVVPVDYSRISVSWEPGPFPNGPILSYVVKITKNDSPNYSAVKVHHLLYIYTIDLLLCPSIFFFCFLFLLWIMICAFTILRLFISFWYGFVVRVDWLNVVKKQPI